MRAVEIRRDTVADLTSYPYSIPSIGKLTKLALHPRVTFVVGENGTGKSTLLEAMAIAAGFNAEGGTRNFNFATRPSESVLHEAVRLIRGARRPRTGYFLRAESFFNVATVIERLDVGPGGPPVANSYGSRPLHEQSHGESFFSLFMNRFGRDGLYIMDEPEAALSPMRQLALMRRMHELARERSQFVIATHSPFLMAYPDAIIYLLTGDGIRQVAYEDTEHFQVARSFLGHREKLFQELLDD